MPERLVDPHRTGAEGESVDEVAIHGGSNALELVQMLQTLQHNILTKLAISPDLR